VAIGIPTILVRALAGLRRLLLDINILMLVAVAGALGKRSRKLPAIQRVLPAIQRILPAISRGFLVPFDVRCGRCACHSSAAIAKWRGFQLPASSFTLVAVAGAGVRYGGGVSLQQPRNKF